MTDKVTLWTQPNCQPCKAVARQLTKAGVEFRSISIQDDMEKLAEFQDMGISSAPVLEAEGFEPILGFNDVAIREVAKVYGVVEQ